MKLLSPPLETVTGLVEDLKRAWRAGAAPDAVAAVHEHPDLLLHRSLVVDLAYEEYCLREEAGSAPNAEDFCNRFPAYQTDVREVIRGHRLLAEHPELLDGTIAWPHPGDTFEQLVVVRELGRGAFARVYLARDPEAGERPVVLKLTPRRSAEARTLGTISHPHIVPILWARESGGLFAVCMPFVGSATLRDAISFAFRGRPAPPSTRAFLDATAAQESPPVVHPALIDDRLSYPDAVATVAARLAGAVEHLHDAGIMHGDLKPSNVLLVSNGHPYLIDFNLSATLTDCPLRCGGTVPYMAPERLRLMLGSSQETSPRAAADIYSFGALLFEALTGRVPVEPIRATEPQMEAADLLNRLTAGPSPLATIPLGVPRPLATLIAQCLDLNPLRRPTISRVKHELERYLARRRRRTWWVLFASSVLTFALIAVGTWFVVTTQPRPPVAKSSLIEDPFTRGIEHLKSDHVSAALKDFADANQAHPDGPNSAYLAYCLSLSGQERAATELYKQAIQQHGFKDPWVRSNYAHALLQAAPTPDILREAEAEAAAALAVQSDLRPARLNRVYACYRQTLTEPPARRVDREALADVKLVMREPPYTVDLYSKAAAMTVAFCGEQDENLSQAVRYLEEAVKLGRTRDSVAKDRLLRPLYGRADFQRVLGLTPGKPIAKPPNPYLAAPPLVLIRAEK